MKIKMTPGTLLLVEDNKAVDDSFEGIRCAVSDALTAKVRAEANDASVWPWVQNMYNDSVVYSVGGEYFQRPYTISGDAVTFGAAQEVEPTYVPVAEAQKVLVVESGRTACTRVLVGIIQSLSESYNAQTGEATITVITPGFNKGKGRYYPADVLKRDYSIFENAKMFLDHQTDAEARLRPEGSVKDYVGQIKKVWAESDGTIRATAAIIDPPFKAKLEELAKNNMLKDMGVSIRAIGEARPEKIEGVETNYIESLLRARSVDFVTYAGAGGQVETLISESDGENDLDLVTESQLRDRRPDLVQLIESRTEQEKNRMKTIEQQLTEATANHLSEKKRADDLQKRLDETETASKKTVAAGELTKLLSEAKTLPEAAKDKLKKQFAEATDSKGMKEAIEAEAAYIRSITPSNGIVRNMGEADAGTGSEGGMTDEDKAKRLQEGFAGMGLNEKEAAIAAKR